MLCWFALRHTVRALEISIQCSGWFEVVGQLIFVLQGSLKELDVEAGIHGDGIFDYGRLAPLAQLKGLSWLKVWLQGRQPQLQLPSPGVPDAAGESGVGPGH